jgi:hypothetical protein
MGFFFSFFVKGAMTFFKLNQCCWQQLVLNVLDFLKLCNVISSNDFLNINWNIVLGTLINVFQTIHYHKWQMELF